MSKHWVIRIQKPSIKVTVSLIVAGAAAVCTCWFIKRFFSRNSTGVNRKCTSDQKKSLHFGHGSSNLAFNPSEESLSLQSRGVLVPNRKLCGQVPPHGNSISTVASLSLDCGSIGLQTLSKIIEQLEECLYKIQNTVYQVNPADLKIDMFIKELQSFLETSYLLRERYKRIFIQQAPNAAPELQLIDSQSDADSESFFSTAEDIDYSELEIHIMSNFHRPFYRRALMELNEGNFVCRSVRTGMMNCQSDIEYLGKLICVRRAFDYIVSQAQPVGWIIQVGRSLAWGVLICLGYSTTEFEEAFTGLLEYLESVKSSANLSSLVDELASKGVQSLNFYDIVFDRILIDALENLGNPPSSILALTRNSWLSSSFKRSALDSAVWTLMAAKRKLLKYSDGFFSRYYRLVETIAPALAWGFLGSDETVNTFCESLRDEMVTFVRSLFMFAESDSSGAVESDCTSSQYLDFDENDSGSVEEEDDATITPDRLESDEGPVKCSPLPMFYSGMDFTSIEATSACIYANMAILEKRLSSLITEFAANCQTDIETLIHCGLSIKQPNLPQASVSDVRPSPHLV
ncbi:unnamed protein product [Mesocestoides corti]|uniref:Mitoguardin 1 n=1 Tax=Mesocestoides corti TaxID=53468 RepID=A0A0R3UQ95_MESCO|nr:unnamed protein product [Mesocestoides corti]